MNLYLLSQDTNRGYDTYSDCVVCAEDENDAKKISPDSSIDIECPTELEVGYNYSSWTIQKNVSCEYIGNAKEGLKRGIICSSFHAG